MTATITPYSVKILVSSPWTFIELYSSLLAGLAIYPNMVKAYSIQKKEGPLTCNTIRISATGDVEVRHSHG